MNSDRARGLGDEPRSDTDMAWLVICRDIADSSALRQRHLKRHLSYVQTVVDLIAVAGPMAESADGDYSGSCFIYRTDDRRVAESLLRNDPYFEAGLYGEVEFHALHPKAGVWLGGAAWVQPGAPDGQ